MSWMNNDGLYVKFGAENGAKVRGGQYSTDGSRQVIEFVVNYTDALSATASILGSASGTETGSFGVLVPKGFFIENVEVVTETAFTSSGTIGSSTFVLGLIREDRSTAYSATALTTTAFVGSAIDAAGEKTTIAVGSTGAGALVGTKLANDGLVIVANSAHATHPFTAGKARVRVVGHFGA